MKKNNCDNNKPFVLYCIINVIRLAYTLYYDNNMYFVSFLIRTFNQIRHGIHSSSFSTSLRICRLLHHFLLLFFAWNTQILMNVSIHSPPFISLLKRKPSTPTLNHTSKIVVALAYVCHNFPAGIILHLILGICIYFHLIIYGFFYSRRYDSIFMENIRCNRGSQPNEKILCWILREFMRDMKVYTFFGVVLR